MSYKRVVILGGGPIGLLCAIEAKKYFKHVTIIEKRLDYSRTNVPKIGDDMRKHLNEIQVGKEIGFDNVHTNVSIARMEEALSHRALQLGVNIIRGFVVTAVAGFDPKKDQTFKQMHLQVDEWDHPGRCIKVHGKQFVLQSDLLIVCTGGSSHTDPVMKTLAFSWSILKAKNYAAFGIFEPIGDYRHVTGDLNAPVFDQGLKKQLYPMAESIAPAKTPLKSHDHNYLLVTLSGCTKSDFGLLKSNTLALKKVLAMLGMTISGTVLHQIKDVDKNVALFKIQIKKANQLYSPFFPAVLVGDAAVTPHPETGSGLVTGFKGFEEIQKLLLALAKTHRSEDNRHHFMNFDQSYHLFVAEKALKGTFTILENLVKTVRIFTDELLQHISRVDHRGTQSVLRAIQREADEILDELGYQLVESEQLCNLLFGKSSTVDEGASIQRLWRRIDLTYVRIKEFTAGVGFLDEKLDEIERRI